jgi:hypothetical protein
MVPEMPTACIFHTPGGACCHLIVHHHRDRKTGPRFPLVVVECQVHGCVFTLYPAGHVPYGRRAVAPVAASGEVIRPAPQEADSEAASPWQGTLFDDALDAADDDPWPCESTDTMEGSWSTLGRLIEQALRILGLAPDMTLDLRHRIADVLAIPTMTLLECVRMIATKPGFRSRGRAILTVLAEIPLASALRRLIVTGHLAELWGPPLLWDVRAQVLRPLTFQRSGTDPP